MKKLIPLLLLVAVLAGCAATPKARTYQFRSSYVAVLTSIDQLTLVNKITPAQAVQIQKLRPIGDAAESAIVALQVSGGSAYDAALTAADAVLSQLIAIEAESKKGK